jgi:hypothetical protein
MESPFPAHQLSSLATSSVLLNAGVDAGLPYVLSLHARRHLMENRPRHHRPSFPSLVLLSCAGSAMAAQTYDT